MFDRDQFLDDYLLELGLDKSALVQARKRSEGSGGGVLKILNQMGRLSDDQLVELLQVQTGLPILETHELPATPESAGFNPVFLKAHQILPIPRSDGMIDVAYTDPTHEVVRNAAEFVLGGARGRSLIIRPSDWKKVFTNLDEASESLLDETSSASDLILQQIIDQDRDAPIARRIASLLADAVESGASDLHIEARRDHVDFRFRIDGELRPVAQEPAAAADALIARIKVIADLDLGERRMPQDGRTTIIVKGSPIDVRVSIVPAAFGESAVLRLLDRPSALLTLEGLGFSASHRDRLHQIMRARDGLFLVAGPTGSGKTTTLYACLQLLAHSKLKILSVEDPIEYQFDHVIQVQASESTDLSFPKVLRAFLRHDPDVIFIGEIRDRETAHIAVQAALTGHLVVASVHAIDADRITTRLTEMGVDAYQLDAALKQALSQRLVRRLCEHCREYYTLGEDELQHFIRAGLSVPVRLARPKGCLHCHGSGFKGRLVIAEFFGEGESDLLRDALEKVTTFETSLNEVLSVLG